MTHLALQEVDDDGHPGLLGRARDRRGVRGRARLTRGREADKTDDEEAALYSAPPEQFVAERNALAKRLADDGDSAGAARVKKLKKPSVPAWAVNRAAREAPGGSARRCSSPATSLPGAQRAAAGEGGGESCARRWAPTQRRSRG